MKRAYYILLASTLVAAVLAWIFFPKWFAYAAVAFVATAFGGFRNATTSPLPTLALLRKVPPAGMCPQCGYDLRATPDRCPECGAILKEALND